MEMSFTKSSSLGVWLEAELQRGEKATAAGVGTRYPAREKTSETSNYRADRNLLIPGMSQCSCYL